jgi:long-chain acyl-CoA synthetase
MDLDLYRREVAVSVSPRVHLSVIDVHPEHPRRTLVFIHGFGGQARQWKHQVEAFGLHHRVIAPDLRGHGLSDKPRSVYDVEELLSDLEALLLQLEAKPPLALIGHSFGGAIATEYALRHPEQVDRLILISTPGEYRLHPIYRFLFHLPLPLLRAAEPFVRPWLHAPAYVLQALYMHAMSRWVGWPRFRSLTQPTLVIRGHRDMVFERPLFEEVARAIPRGEDLNVGASRHMVMIERYEAVNRAIGRFLEDRPTRSWREPYPATISPRSALWHQRPWLAFYDEGVPPTVAIPHIPLHELLRSAARRFPNHHAICFGNARYTYRELNREVNRFAHALRSLGLNMGERVAILLPNLPQFIIAFYGTLKAGGVTVLLPPGEDEEELKRQIADAEVRILITLTTQADAMRRLQRELGIPHLLLTAPGDYLLPIQRFARREAIPPVGERGVHLWREWLAPYPDHEPDIPVDPGSPAVILYTGGTTAAAKGVMLSHRNLVANALQARHWMPDAQEGRERFLCVLPFSHSYGLTMALNVPMALGAAMIVLPGFDPERVLKAIQRFRPTIFPGVPSMYVAINSIPGVRRYGIDSIRACISGSAPLPLEVQEAFERLTRGRLVEGYGLTEASPVTHANPLYGLRKVGSIGIPLPSTEARIVDLRTGRNEVPPGHIGELAVRGPQVMLGYWRDPEATRRVLTEDGWLLTGDIAQMDEDGYFRLIARKADMWYVGKEGQPAFPRDVEEVLYEIPSVKEAAVVAVAGQPIAFVIARKEQVTNEEIIAYCRRRLPPELVPRMVFFVDEFPRTFLGKVLRRELARRYEQWQREKGDPPRLS